MRILHFSPTPVLILGLALLTSVDVAASPPELVTDRPDQTESSETVPHGWLQLETGVTYTREGDDLSVVEGPGTLLRVGLLDSLELRLGWGGWATVDPPRGASFDGLADAELGAKLRLHEGDATQLALLASSSLPMGDDELTSDRFDPSIRLTAAHDLGLDGVDFAWNLGVAWESTADGTGTSTLGEIVYTAAAGFSLGDRLGAFVEVFGSEPTSRPGGHAASFDGGFTYLLRPTLQLDAFAGVGLTDDAPDWFVGVGLSTLWRR